MNHDDETNQPRRIDPLERIRREIVALRILLQLPAACIVIHFLVWLYRGIP